MLNKITLIGRVGREPEPHYSRAGAFFANFSLEVTSHTPVQAQGEQEDELHWFNVTVLGEAAENANNYLHKGSMVYIEGCLQSDNYVNTDGVEVTAWYVLTEYLELLDTAEVTPFGWRGSD